MLEAERYFQRKLKTFYEILEEQSKSVTNDARQRRYCKYITEFASHFGNERCYVVGSTIEKTRLRSHKDEGDYDYLIISEIPIPLEALEHRKDLPCFVHICNDKLKTPFSGDLVLDGKYLHSRVLKHLDKEAFKITRGLFQVLTTPKGRHTKHVEINREAKPGTSQQRFAGWQMVGENTDVLYQRQVNPTTYFEDTKRYFHSIVEASHMSSNMKGLLCNLFNMIGETIETDEDAIASLFQTFGGMMEAASTSDNLSPPKKQKQHQAEEDEQCNADSNEREFFVRFNYKSSKDFIPAFALEGKLKCLHEWKQRMITRKEPCWPEPDTIEKIFNSEVYVVAKPAIVNPTTSKDFCLGFNQAELILAESLSPDQKLCMLLLKSLQKGFLGCHSQTLTTFHWKTAFYRMCEQTDPSLFDRKSTILLALNSVLSYMAECLENRYLQHYFIESNLIAHITTTEANEIRSKIREIIKDPEEALQVYFEKKESEKTQTEKLSKGDLDQLKQHGTKSAKKDHTDKILTMLSQFQTASESDDSKLTKALLDTIYLVLEEEKDFRDKKTDLSSQEGSVSHLVTQAARYQATNFSNREDKKKALEELRSNAMQMFFTAMRK